MDALLKKLNAVVLTDKFPKRAVFQLNKSIYTIDYNDQYVKFVGWDSELVILPIGEYIQIIESLLLVSKL